MTKYAIPEKPIRIAWLTESGTGYGAATAHAASKSYHDDDIKLRRKKRAVEIINFQFPVNIARVRAAYQEERRRLQATQSTLGPDHYRVPIPFNEDSPALDLPSMQAPNMTAPSDELVIGQILATIRNAGIEYVAITASDIRDPVVLTELIKEQAPDAQILLITSDLLHLHSEYRATMHGALVASPYSLCPEDQDWCFPFEGGRQKVVLPSANLYGLFNSIVLLRGLQRGDLTFDPAKELLTLESDWQDLGAKPLAYGMPLLNVDPLTSEFAPPVWISMIGSTGIWPLECKLPKNKSKHDLDALVLEVPWEKWTGRDSESERPTADEELATALPKPSFDPRIPPSSEFLMWFWVCLALVYLWHLLGSSTSPWGRPYNFRQRNEHDTTPTYLCPCRCFRAATTLALLAAVTLDGVLALIPLWFAGSRLDWLGFWLTARLCAFAGIAATGLAGALVIDVF